MFACEHANISPDIMCIGKALTGGAMTLSATLATEEVAVGISQGEAGVLMHGPTFMGNPLACSAANASIELLEEYNWFSQINRIEKTMIKHLSECSELDAVEDVRVLGGIGVVQVKRAVDVAKIQRYFIREHKVWIRPFGKLIYIMPPYISTDSDIMALCTAIYEAIVTEEY